MGRFWVLCVLALMFASLAGASEHEFEEYKDSLVSVKEADEGSMKGSGFVYSPDGYIVTNNHIVVENGTEEDLEVKFNHTGEWIDVRTVGRDPETDLAVLKADELPEGTESLQISNSTLQEGQNVIILGNPRDAEGMFISGKVVDVNEDITTKGGVTLGNAIVISASVEPGSSGGPVLISNGEVVGVVSARKKNEAIAFAVPASTVRDVVPNLIQNRTAESVTVTR